MARKLKHVNVFRDRHGHVRVYFRRQGYPNVSLPAFDAPDFQSAYAAALAGVPAQIGADRTMPGTIDALAVAYYRSAAWQSLSEDTRSDRRRIIERFRGQHGSKRATLLRCEHIIAMLAAIERPSVRRAWLVTLRALLRSGIPLMLKETRCRRRI
jgi:hypothetical protein